MAAIIIELLLASEQNHYALVASDSEVTALDNCFEWLTAKMNTIMTVFANLWLIT